MEIEYHELNRKFREYSEKMEPEEFKNLVQQISIEISNAIERDTYASILNAYEIMTDNFNASPVKQSWISKKWTKIKVFFTKKFEDEDYE